MKLYWTPRTRSIRALWILEESGLPYSRETICSAPTATAKRRAVKGPALEDGGARLAESAALCAYVAEKATDAALAPPAGDPARERYFHWLFFQPASIERASAAGWRDFGPLMRALDAALSVGPWVLGEKFSAADVMIGTDLLLGVEWFKLIDPTPALRSYLDRCKARPAIQRALAIDAAAA